MSTRRVDSSTSGSLDQDAELRAAAGAHQRGRGGQATGWFTEDFTVAELKTLRAVERLPQVRQHNTLYDGPFQGAEVLDLRARLSRDLGRRIGVYPETKHPTYLRAAAGGAPGHRVRSSEQCSVQATSM